MPQSKVRYGAKADSRADRLLLLVLILMQSALSGIYVTALYRYVANDSASTSFDNGVLQGAFQPKD